MCVNSYARVYTRDLYYAEMVVAAGISIRAIPLVDHAANAQDDPARTYRLSACWHGRKLRKLGNNVDVPGFQSHKD